MNGDEINYEVWTFRHFDKDLAERGERWVYEDIVEGVFGLISSSSVVDQCTLTLGMFC